MESRGHALESGKVTTSRAVRKRKSPAIIKREAKKRYMGRLLSLIARTAQEPPATKSEKAIKTDILEVCSREPIKNVIPNTMKKIPAIKTILAVSFRFFFKLIT